MLESPWPANLMYVGGQELPISSKAGDFFHRLEWVMKCGGGEVMARC
jgi:hypothetical protein